MNNLLIKVASEIINEVLFFIRLFSFPKRRRLLSSLLLTSNKVQELYPKLYPYYPLDLPSLLHHKKSNKSSKCAVVFNNSDLLGKNLGSEIDSADIIIRINFCPTIGFESDLGSRTTFRILGKEWVFYEDSSEYLIRTYNRTEYYDNDIANLEASEVYRNLNLFVMDPYLADIYPKKLIGSGVTNGFRAVLLGLTCCDSVTIYGASLKTLFLLKQYSVSHFPGSSFAATVREKYRSLRLKVDSSSEYFSNLIDGLDRKPHKSLHREYLFYFINRRITFRRIKL